MKKTDIGFVCPNCKKYCNGKVIESRETDYGRRRRRECELCNTRFTTIERCVTIQRSYGNENIKA